MTPGQQAYLRFRELERQAREALDADAEGAAGWAWVRQQLARVYLQQAVPGTDALRNLGRPLHDSAVDERSLRRVEHLAAEFQQGLGLPAGAWAAGPVDGWRGAVAEVAGARAAAAQREQPPAKRPATAVAPLPRAAGWAAATALRTAEARFRQELDGEPHGDAAALALDVALAPVHADLAAPSSASLAPLAEMDLGPRTTLALEQLAARLTVTTAAPGWQEAVAERAPEWLAAAAARRSAAEARGQQLPHPAPPRLEDDPGWTAFLSAREQEQRLREVLDPGDVLRLDRWLRALYDGTSSPAELGPLALSGAAGPAAGLADRMRSVPSDGRGWRLGLAAASPAWLASADRRAQPSVGDGALSRLRTRLGRA